ncbi:universal stress protein [Dehalobacterium formicoaceticum]|uniref:Universal stress protein n=1 Tax=Dehalobacterium formicoaceticum TaxID=51515 RepID=A0ABT1Y560_9FIRM|nr:universal stress protein [Dehalobacterium formicoaceticum]MCR6546006.1 universal stress protein [Dehalobacterium formicoaceticum]
MLKKILLAVDGSDQGMKAADYAVRLAHTQEGLVEIIYVINNTQNILSDVPFMDPAMSVRLKEEMANNLIETGKNIIAQANEKFRDTGISYTTKVIEGDPAEEILREAENQNVDVIVIGSRGLSGVTRFFLGSVSNKVVNHAHCSVFIVR